MQKVKLSNTGCCYITDLLLLSTQPTQEIDIVVAWHALNGTLEGLQSLIRMQHFLLGSISVELCWVMFGNLVHL